MAQAQDELIGKRLGGYDIIDRIGQGGMATVYRAQQLSMNRDVAIKILPRQFLNDDSYLARFDREVKIVSKLEHRSIVPVYDYGQHEGQPYIAMRYMQGGSLDDILSKRGPLPLDLIVRMLEQIAPALDFAHSKGVLHRDLKPSNILLDDGDGAYITDFGIARILGEGGQGITTQGVVGTPSYMSPEQAQGQTLDNRSDIYSLGVMLFELTTGRRPFYSDTPYSIAVMQVTTPPPLPRSINPNVTPAVERVILRAMDKKSAGRYDTAVALCDAVRQAMNAPKLETQPRPPNITMPLHTQPLPNSPAQGHQTQQPPNYAPPAPAYPPTQPYAPHGQAPQPYQAAPPITYPPPQGAPQYNTYPQGNPPASGYNAPYAPSSPSQAAVPAYTGTGSSDAVYVPKKRRKNAITDFFLGGALGCVALIVLVGIVALGLWMLLRNVDSATPTPNRNTTPAVSAADVTATAAALASANGGATPDIATPIGIEQAYTIRPTAESMGSSVLFYGLRPYEGTPNYDIWRIDLNTSIETQLTAGGAVESYPSASPDGAWIVYQSNADGDFELYIMDRFGGNTRKLTDNSYSDRLPSWSPDGQWIVFSSDVRNTDTHDLYIIRPDGSDLTELYSNGQRNAHARFSPIEPILIFTTGEPRDANTWEIAAITLTVQADGRFVAGDFFQLTENELQDNSPNYSADGSEIVYITAGDGGAAIAVMARDGSNPRVVYDSDGEEWGAHFSLNNSAIVFNRSSSSDATQRVYIINPDGTNEQQVTTISGMYPSFLP
jgi:serine/threonine protein kinase/Tol biopolymer transport system component